MPIEHTINDVTWGELDNFDWVLSNLYVGIK